MRLGGLLLLSQLAIQAKATPRPQITYSNGSDTNNQPHNSNGTSNKANSWKTMKCAQLQGDATGDWKAANGDAAWNTTTTSWRQLHSNGKGFPQFVSEFLHGPDGMRCNDFATENRCAMPVECENNIIPAGYVKSSDPFLSVIRYDPNCVTGP